MSGNKIFVTFLAIVATFGFLNAQQTIPLLPETCLLETNSPQFAILCNLPNGTNAPLPAFNLQTANQVCDGDCRCVMGATQRGGRCGARPDGKIFCICDYNTTPVRAPLTPGNCTALFQNTLLGVCIPPNIINRLCDSDCICSHGYPNATGSAGSCYVNPTVSEDDNKYCFCNGGKNYFTVPT